MHQPERVVEGADRSLCGCVTPDLHFFCIFGKRHALRFRNGCAVIEYEIGACPHDRCAKATEHA